MYLVGFLILSGSLILGGRAGYILYKMYQSGKVSAPMWAPQFWFWSTNYREGITPEAKQLLIIIGSIMLFFLGKHIMNLGDIDK